VQSSEKERNATEAERAVDDYYKILYISDYQGEEFDAVVSGVTNFGVFAELSNGVEGLIRIETLRGRRYELDRERYVLSNGKYAFRLGQPIKIKVAGVNIMDKRAEFVLAE
jgi:ribonuclease R